MNIVVHECCMNYGWRGKFDEMSSNQFFIDIFCTCVRPIGWGHPEYTCCSPPVTLVENVKKNIQNEYYIKTLFFFADER